MANEKFFVWEGRYSNFSEARRVGAGFSDTEWVRRTSERLSALRAMPPLERTAVHEYLFPCVVGAIAEAGHKLTIVDFAGGVGIEYEQLRAALEKSVSLAYHIIDNPAICEVGIKLHSNNPELSFHQTNSSLPASADIVHMGSALQYIEDWQALLKVLTKLAPRRLLLSDVYAGDIESFVTVQNLYGSQVPFQFLSFQKIVETLASCGYELVLTMRFLRRVLGKVGPLPMENLPAECRIDYPKHLLFRPKGA